MTLEEMKKAEFFRDDSLMCSDSKHIKIPSDPGCAIICVGVGIKKNGRFFANSVECKYASHI